MTRLAGAALLWTLLLPIQALADGNFPLRAKYPQVAVISTAQLRSEYDTVTKVDVRSSLEFETVHMKGAHLVSLGSTHFDPEVRRLSESGKKIVFYCNGHTCAKSYKAAVAAKKNGIDQVYAYDAGIFDWAKADPDRAVLLSETPVDSDRLIPESRFQERILSLAEFRKKLRSKDALAIDVRDEFQIEGRNAPFQTKHLPVDRLVFLLSLDKYKGRSILIVDAVGKQVRWLQYYLEKNGYRDYYFLKDGALSFDQGPQPAKRN